MQLRQIEIFAPRGSWTEMRETLTAFDTQEVWETDLGKSLKSIRFFLQAARSDELLDIFEKRFAKREGFRIVIYPVEATIPRLEKEELPEEKVAKKPINALIGNQKLVSIHREELYAGVAAGVELTPNKVILFGLSAIVAAIGLLNNNVAIIIGSMVIAPFLGPNVGLALSTTLGDTDLMKKSLKNLLIGTVLVAVLAIGWGLVSGAGSALASQAFISYDMIILSFVSGVAAIVSLLQNEDSALVGVMVAVSLLPPLTLSGILLGSGFFVPALKAFLLFVANIVCLNLAGIATFMWAGIRPHKRWEAKKAKKQTQKAMKIWGVMLLVLLIMTYFLTN